MGLMTCVQEDEELDRELEGFIFFERSVKVL
jgi:hypothetical protein